MSIYPFTLEIGMDTTLMLLDIPPWSMALDRPRKIIKEYHHPKDCPVEGYSAVVKRLPHHLRIYHKIPPSEQLEMFGFHSDRKLHEPSSEESDTDSVMESNVENILDDLENLRGNDAGILFFPEMMNPFKAYLRSPLGRELVNGTVEQDHRQIFSIYNTGKKYLHIKDHLEIFIIEMINKIFII